MAAATVGIGRYRLKWLTGQWTMAEVKCFDVRFEAIISRGCVGAFKYTIYILSTCRYVYVCVSPPLNNKVAAELGSH